MSEFTKFRGAKAGRYRINLHKAEGAQDIDLELIMILNLGAVATRRSGFVLLIYL